MRARQRAGGTKSAFTTREVAAAAVAESARKGYLDGQALAGVSLAAAERPDLELVVNNYRLGKEPPAFDILYWNQDTVRLAAGLHRDFVRRRARQRVHDVRARSRSSAAASTSGRSRSIDISSPALTDHIVPWESAYNGALLYGGNRRFVLSRSGHIQALVNPPAPDGTESRSSFRVADELPATPEEFMAEAVQLPGSWWGDWDAWLAERSGGLKPAPKSLGNAKYKAQGKAPGTYVLAELDDLPGRSGRPLVGVTTCARRGGRSRPRACSRIRFSTGAGCRAAMAARSS